MKFVLNIQGNITREFVCRTALTWIKRTFAITVRLRFHSGSCFSRLRQISQSKRLSAWWSLSELLEVLTVLAQARVLQASCAAYVRWRCRNVAREIGQRRARLKWGLRELFRTSMKYFFFRLMNKSCCLWWEQAHKCCTLVAPKNHEPND